LKTTSIDKEKELALKSVIFTSFGPQVLDAGRRQAQPFVVEALL